MRNSFVFYSSWWEAIKNLPRDVQGDVLTAIIEYGLYGETTEQLKPIAKAMLAMAKSQIDINNQRFETGKKGGRPKPENNQEEAKQKPNYSQNQTKEEPNNNLINNDNVNVNVNANEECPPYNSPQGESAPPESNEGDKINYNALMDTFNRMFDGKLPKVTTMTDKRKKAVKARASEHGKEAIMAVFNNVSKSAFLLGHNNQNWSCDFDWIFRPTNFIKILEGNYNGERISKNQQDSEQRKRDSVLAVATTVREAAAKKRKELEAEGVIE